MERMSLDYGVELHVHYSLQIFAPTKCLWKHVTDNGVGTARTCAVLLSGTCWFLHPTSIFNFFFYWRYNPLWVCILHPSNGSIASSHTRFLNDTQWRATVGRTSLDEWSIVAETSTWQHTRQQTNIHPRWDSNPRSQQASGRRPTP